MQVYLWIWIYYWIIDREYISGKTHCLVVYINYNVNVRYIVDNSHSMATFSGVGMFGKKSQYIPFTFYQRQDVITRPHFQADFYHWLSVNSLMMTKGNQYLPFIFSNEPLTLAYLLSEWIRRPLIDDAFFLYFMLSTLLVRLIAITYIILWIRLC